MLHDFQPQNPRLSPLLYVTCIAAARAHISPINGSVNISNMLEVENVNWLLIINSTLCSRFFFFLECANVGALHRRTFRKKLLGIFNNLHPRHWGLGSWTWTMKRILKMPHQWEDSTFPHYTQPSPFCLLSLKTLNSIKWLAKLAMVRNGVWAR